MPTTSVRTPNLVVLAQPSSSCRIRSMLTGHCDRGGDGGKWSAAGPHPVRLRGAARWASARRMARALTAPPPLAQLRLPLLCRGPGDVGPAADAAQRDVLWRVLAHAPAVED